MFKRLIQMFRRHRIAKLLKVTPGELPYCCAGEDTYWVFDIVDGELVAWNTGTLERVPATEIYVPFKSDYSTIHRDSVPCCNWDNVETTIKFMLERKLSPSAMVPFVELTSGMWYVGPLSLTDPGYLVLFNTTRMCIRVPFGVLSKIKYGIIEKMHPYTIAPMDIATKEPLSTWSPIIRLVPLADGTVESAYSYMHSDKNYPGMMEYRPFDLIIDIQRLDNSSTPIVNLPDFLDVFDEYFEHGNKNYTVNVRLVKLMMGMFPQPIPVGKLDNDVGVHRVIWENEPDHYGSCATYINTECLPTSYP